jgi:hypothetical protein
MAALLLSIGDAEGEAEELSFWDQEASEDHVIIQPEAAPGIWHEESYG